MHSPLSPVDELACIRAEMRRLKAREAVLRASLRDRDPRDPRRQRPDTAWHGWDPFAGDDAARPTESRRRAVTLEARAEPAQPDRETVQYRVMMP